MVYDFRNKTNKNKDDNETQLYMNGIKLNEVKKIRFLGVIINNQLTWTDHKTHIKSKICKALGIIYSSREILRHSHLINIYNTFIQPYFNYCITLWGSSLTSETDPLIKLQNKVLRVLFSCKRSEDAWEMDEKQKILKVRHLYFQEIAKLCYKHHLDLNPPIINSIMPEKYNTNTAMLLTRSKTNHNYKQTKINASKTLTKNCIKIWNNLPTELKNLAYDNEIIPIKMFTSKARTFIVKNL